MFCTKAGPKVKIGSVKHVICHCPFYGQAVVLSLLFVVAPIMLSGCVFGPGSEVWLVVFFRILQSHR